jgi:hypothetical protein
VIGGLDNDDGVAVVNVVRLGNVVLEMMRVLGAFKDAGTAVTRERFNVMDLVFLSGFLFYPFV